MPSDAQPFTPPLFFIINGGSGRRDAQATCESIESAMRTAARRYRLFIIEDANDLPSTVQQGVDEAEAENGAVVAVGGDGTINAVATAALGRRCYFGAIPQGTFNYFGRSLGIPEDIEAALQDLLHGQATPVQVGLVNDRVFLVNASVGLYPQLLEDREAFKQRYGRSRLVALWSAIATALGDHRYLDLVLDQGGELARLRTTTLFIGNNRLQLEQVGVEQAESVKQGRLAAIAVKPVGTLALLWLAARGALGKLGADENIESFNFRSLTVSQLGLLQGKRGQTGAEYGVETDADIDTETRAGAKTHVDANAGKKAKRKQRIKVAADGEIMWLNAPLVFRVATAHLQLIKRSPQPDNATRPASDTGHKSQAA